MNIIIIFIIILLVISFLSKKEKFNYQSYDQTNLAALSRNELQTPREVDLSKIDWTKLDDYSYSKILCIIQGCDEKAIIKNLPVFTSGT